MESSKTGFLARLPRFPRSNQVPMACSSLESLILRSSTFPTRYNHTLRRESSTPERPYDRTRAVPESRSRGRHKSVRAGFWPCEQPVQKVPFSQIPRRPARLKNVPPKEGQNVPCAPAGRTGGNTHPEEAPVLEHPPAMRIAIPTATRPQAPRRARQSASSGQ